VIWRGVYDSFRDVPCSGPSFAGDVWTGMMAEAGRQALTQLKAGSLDVSADRAPYAMSLGILATSRRLVVVDYGGGLGIDYLHALAAAPWLKPRLDYYIVETDAICALGREMFRGEERISFHAAIPAHLASVDIVHLNGVLQFVDDWAGLLERLAGLRPEWLSLSAIPAGAARTYASAQHNVEGSTIPAWFFRSDAFLKEVERLGYALVAKVSLRRHFEQENFPPELRVGFVKSFLFRRAVMLNSPGSDESGLAAGRS